MAITHLGRSILRLYVSVFFLEQECHDRVTSGSDGIVTNPWHTHMDYWLPQQCRAAFFRAVALVRKGQVGIRLLESHQYPNPFLKMDTRNRPSCSPGFRQSLPTLRLSATSQTSLSHHVLLHVQKN